MSRLSGESPVEDESGPCRGLQNLMPLAFTRSNNQQHILYFPVSVVIRQTLHDVSPATELMDLEPPVSSSCGLDYDAR
jgi:hypothetical protein